MALRNVVRYDLGTLDANGEATNGFFSQDYRNAVVTVVASSDADLTLSFFTSNSEAEPNFANAASSTNIYAPAEVNSLNDGSSITGTTGLVITSGGTASVRMYEINQNLNTWIGCKITAYAAGNVVLYLALGDNQ